MNYIQKTIRNSKFTGNLSHSIEMPFELYEMTIRQYNANPDQMEDLFVYTRGGPTRTIFTNNVPHGETFHGIKIPLNSKFNSNHRQIQAKRIIDIHGLKTAMPQRGLTNSTGGLSWMVAIIEEWGPQYHLEFRSDRHKIG